MHVVDERARESRAAAVFMAAVLIPLGLYILLTAKVQNDDPYITFRYAWNLAHGRGFVFNGGEVVAGMTTPLYGLLLASLFALKLPLAVAVAIPTALGFGLIAISSWTLFRRAGLPWGGTALAAVLVAEPRLYFLYGQETALAIGLTLAAFALHAAGRWTAAFVCAALLIGVRPDGALVGLVLALVSFKEDRRRLWTALLWAAAVFAPLYAAFVLYYRVPVPHTLAVKMAQGTRGVAPFWKGTERTILQMYFGRDFIPSGLLALVGTWVIVRRRWLAIPLYVLLYALAFILLNPPFFYDWYQYPFWILRASAIAWGIGLAGQWRGPLEASWRRLAGPLAAAALLAGAIGLRYASRGEAKAWHPDRWDCYRRVAERVSAMSVEPRRIVLEEIGIIGFALRDWEVIDTEGLIHRRPLGEVIGDDPPPLAVIRGTPERYAIRGTRREFVYRAIERFAAPHYSCTLMALEPISAERSGEVPGPPRS